MKNSQFPLEAYQINLFSYEVTASAEKDFIKNKPYPLTAALELQVKYVRKKQKNFNTGAHLPI